MSYEQKEGDVIIFKNTKAEGNQPQYTGKGIYNGDVIRIALWVKDGKESKFFAGKIQADKQTETHPAEETQSDDLPF